MPAKYTFDPNIAKKYGVDEAVMLENIYFWVQKNEANNKHFYDVNYWTYNSIQAFVKQFPFWTNRQIDRILKNLEKNGAIITGNYNKSPYDRTKWYAVTETAKSIYLYGEMGTTKNGNDISPNSEINSTELLNETTQIVKPIPYVNTDVNQITTTDKEEKENNGCSSNNETELNNFKLYEMLGFGTLNSVTMADIKILEEQYTKKWVEEALKEANDQGTRTMKYVKGILKNWKVTGIKKSKDKDNSSSNNQSSYRNPKPTEVFNSQMYEEFNPNEEIPDYDTVYRETCERMRRKREAEYKKKQITT